MVYVVDRWRRVERKKKEKKKRVEDRVGAERRAKKGWRMDDRAGSSSVSEEQKVGNRCSDGPNGVQSTAERCRQGWGMKRGRWD